MRNALKSVDHNCIARWIYTKEEWRHFAKWHAKDKGVFSYIWHFIFQQKKLVQAIEFTDKTVQIGNKRKIFKSSELELRRVDIDERGKMNIMNITYESTNHKNEVREIRLPIPRGKLKEAIDVQVRLMKIVKT
jgi:hypothetical protein